MSKTCTMLAAAAMAAVAGSASAAIIYNPVVTMIGDGAAIVSSQSRTTTLRVYANSTASQAVPVSELAFNSGSSGTRLTNSDSATSEGMLSNNPGTADAAAAGTAYGGTIYTYSAGYDAANATSSVNSTATDAPRVVGYMNATSGSLSAASIPVSQTQATAYANDNFRSATGDDAAAKFWTGGNGSGSTQGWRYFNSNTQLATTNSTNVRSTEIRNGQLFGSTGAGSNHGIYAIGTGLPETLGTASILINTTSSGSTYEFVLIDDPNNAASTAATFGFDTAYIADDRTTAGGIQKWILSGTTWSLAYTLYNGTDGNRGLAGQLDTDTGKVTLWASTAAGDKLEQVTDNGVGSTFTTLATATSPYLFRGVALTSVSVPEPGTLGLLAIASLAMLVRRRNSRQLVIG